MADNGLFMHMAHLPWNGDQSPEIYTTSAKPLADQDGCLHILDCILPSMHSPHSGMLHRLVEQRMFCDRDSVEEGLRLSEECLMR